MSPCFIPSIWLTKLALFPQGQTRFCMTSVGRLRYGAPLNGRASGAVGAEAQAERRRTEISVFPAVGIKQETISLRLELVQAEFDRLEADASRRAQEERNRSSDDENQRRLTEGRAHRIERRLEAVRHFAALRRARIEAAHFPEASPEERCWQVVIHPRERTQQ